MAMGRPWKYVTYFSLVFSPLSVEAGSLIEPEALCFIYVGWSPNPQDPDVPTFQCWGYRHA